MLSVVQHHQDVFSCLPSVVAENPYTWSDSFSFDRQTDLSGQQLCPADFSSFSWAPLDNALGLFDMYESESVPTNERIPPASTMTTSNSFSTPFSHRPPTFDSLVQYGQPSVPHNPFVYPEPAFTSVQETRVRCLNRAAQESSLVPKPTLHSHRGRGRASRLLPGLSTAHSHYAPYLPTSDNTQKRDSSTHTYHCQWADGGIHLCGAAVVGTRAEIWRHLHEAHAIQLNADKTMQNCMWETCGKSMRRESIARHILTVHCHDKVRCPSCRTHFARRDSLQRHQRSCASREEASQDVCTVVPGVQAEIL